MSRRGRGAKDDTAKVTALYEQMKTDWERKHKKGIDSGTSWKLHADAAESVRQRATKRRRSSKGEADGTRATRARSEVGGQSYKGSKGVNDRFKHATLGDGVDIRKTTVPGASAKNKGLFTCRQFLENELITEYTGPKITRKEAQRLRKEGKASHIRGLNYDFCIDGDKHPVKGQGIAQFANDATREGKNNAKFEMKFDLDMGDIRCFIKAVRVIEADEEIFVGYGNGYWLKDRATGEKIYSEDAHEKNLQYVEKMKKEEEERQMEREQRARERKEEAKRKHQEKMAELRRIEEEKLQLKVQKMEQRAEERAAKKAAQSLEREAAKGQREEERRRERQIKQEKRQKELEETRRKREAEKEKERKKKALAKEKEKEKKEKIENMRRLEAEELFRLAEVARKEKMKKAAEARAKKKKAEQAERKQQRQLVEEADRQKHLQAAREKKEYEKRKVVWEVQNGKSITSGAAWKIWEEVRLYLLDK